MNVLFSFAVSFMAGKKMYRVEGRFLLCDPWWQITCTVRHGQHKAFVKGYPSYSLRTNLRSESLVPLFLKACRAQPDFVTMFMQWLPNGRRVELVNVLDALQEFEDSSPENKAVAEELKAHVNSSGWKMYTMSNCIICITHKTISKLLLK